MLINQMCELWTVSAISTAFNGKLLASINKTTAITKWIIVIAKWIIAVAIIIISNIPFSPSLSFSSFLIFSFCWVELFFLLFFDFFFNSSRKVSFHIETLSNFNNSKPLWELRLLVSTHQKWSTKFYFVSDMVRLKAHIMPCINWCRRCLFTNETFCKTKKKLVEISRFGEISWKM